MRHAIPEKEWIPEKELKKQLKNLKDKRSHFQVSHESTLDDTIHESPSPVSQPYINMTMLQSSCAS